MLKIKTKSKTERWLFCKKKSFLASSIKCIKAKEVGLGNEWDSPCYPLIEILVCW